MNVASAGPSFESLRFNCFMPKVSSKINQLLDILFISTELEARRIFFTATNAVRFAITSLL